MVKIQSRKYNNKIGDLYNYNNLIKEKEKKREGKERRV